MLEEERPLYQFTVDITNDGSETIKTERHEDCIHADNFEDAAARIYNHYMKMNDDGSYTEIEIISISRAEFPDLDGG